MSLAPVRMCNLYAHAHMRFYIASSMAMAESGTKVETSCSASWKRKRHEEVVGIKSEDREPTEGDVLQEQYEIQEEEIAVTEETSLERGCWGEVKIVEFRGLRVAAHYLVVRPSLNQKLSNDMKVISRIRHPNLVLFMGASFGKDVIVLMEYLPTFTPMKKHYERSEEDSFSLETCISIGLDIARALNYLHLIQPYPIVHGQLNSSNVLLEQLMSARWRAKVSDYCFTDFRQPVCADMKAYMAPEASLSCSAFISPKMDIFSLGVLLIQLYTNRIPSALNLVRLRISIKDHHFSQLIQLCNQRNRDCRPSASDLIASLNQRLMLRTQVSTAPYYHYYEALFSSCKD